MTTLKETTEQGKLVLNSKEFDLKQCMEECVGSFRFQAEAARKTLTTNWRAMLDDPLTLERYWLGQAAAGTLVTPEERIAQVAAVTRGDIVAAAQATALDTVYFMKGAAQ